MNFLLNQLTPKHSKPLELAYLVHVSRSYRMLNCLLGHIINVLQHKVMSYCDVFQSIHLYKYIFEQFDQLWQLVLLAETLHVDNGNGFIKGMGEE